MTIRASGGTAISIDGLGVATLDRLRAGDEVTLSGRLLTLRDASAARLAATIAAGEPLPVALEGAVLYAMGPSPPKPGQIIGSAGPTTTERMARYLPALFGAGVRAVIGKGELHGDDAQAFVRHGAIYFAAIGGLGALLAKRITRTEVAAFEDLGPEALYQLEVDAFPAVVIIDRHGHNFHEAARARWRSSGT
jgi:fumarate hydratase subunit beta